MARRMPRLRLLIVAAAVPLLLWGVLPVLSQGQGLQGRIDKKRAQIDAKKGRERVLTSDITSLSHQIGALQSEITTLQSRQVRLRVGPRRQARGARAHPGAAAPGADPPREAARSTRRVADRARRRASSPCTRPASPTSSWSILKSDGFAQMLERTEFIQRIGEQDKRIIDAVRAAKAESAATAKRLDGLEARQQRITAAVAAKRDEVVAVKGRSSRAGSSTRPCANRAGACSRTCARTATSLEGDLQALEAQQAQIRARLAAAAAASRRRRRRPRPVRCSRARAGSSGRSTARSSSGFGMRWGRLHAGVDIAVPAGTPIAAAASGTVVLLGWADGYGNYTCIDHGGGLSTCYAHQSGYATSRGRASPRAR